MGKDFEAFIDGDSPRAEEWRAVFGETKVEITSPIAQVMSLPIGIKNAYYLDLARLTADQHERLVAHLARKFNIPLSEVEEDIEAMGVPILADDVMVVIRNPQKWF